MRNFFTTLLAVVAIVANAQYIPNGNFDSWKGDGNAGSTYQSSNGNEMRKRPGDEPESWYGSSINQSVKVFFANATKQETLIFKSTGRNGSAVKLQNKWVGAAGIGSNAPAFISFATPWVYAVSDVAACDGGMYGSMPFSYRPDAIKGWFKRTGGTGEKAHIIAYLWKGTFKNDITSAKSNDTKDDTDRAVMGKVSSSGNGVRIASCDHEFSTTTNNDWQEITVPLNYENDFIPEKLNIIISSGDYWTRNNVQENSVLEADDVEFVYYSELASLTYNGKNYFQKGKTSYTIDEPYYENKLSVTSNGRGAVIEKSFDNETCVLTITVKGNDCAASGSRVQGYTIDAIMSHIKRAAKASGNHHTYTVAFKPEEPLTVVSVTPGTAVESLRTIAIEYSDVISGTYKPTSSTKIYVGTVLNKASFSVNGKVLNITLDREITLPGEYPLYIPKGLVTREVSGKDVTCDGEIVFTVKAPELEVLSVTPDKPVWNLKNITVEYSDEIVGTYSDAASSRIFVGSSENTASFSVNGRVLSIVLDKKLETAGEHGLYIPEGLITRKANGEDVVCNGEIKFTVRDASEKVTAEVVSVTPSKPVESLQTIVVEYDEDIEGEYDPFLLSEIYVDSLRTTTKPLKVNGASFVVEKNFLTLTLKNEITAPGEYMLYIPEGLITCKSNGEAVVCNGEIKFTVASVNIEPLEVVSVTPAEVVESLQTISIEYSDDIAGAYNAAVATKIYLGSKNNTASFSVAGRVLTIVVDNPITVTGSYPLYIPAGLVTREINGEDVVCSGEIVFTVKEPEPEPTPDDGPKELGERLYSLANANPNKTYVLYNEQFTAYAIYEEGHGDKVWVAGMVGGDSDHQLKDADYAQEVDITSRNACWQVIKDGDKYQLYNVGAGMYLNTPMYTYDDALKYCSFSSEPVSLSVVDLGGGKFAFNAYPSHANAEFGYMCAAPQLDAPISVWNTADAGAAWLLIDNPNVTIGEAVEPTPGEDVDYTPTNTGTRNYSERDINAVKFVSATYGEKVYDLSASERSDEYLDLTGSFVFDVAPGEEASVEIVTIGSWINHYIYIDYDFNGFTAGIENGSYWKPTGDLVSYSFYNNGGGSDDSGWNSLGHTVSGNDRSFPSIPAFTVPEVPGIYRMRIKQDWCSIDPAGDGDSNFGGTFSNYGGQIIDVVLNVTDGTGVENVEVGDVKKVIYDLQGRKLSEIVKSGIYIINGKKVLVK